MQIAGIVLARFVGFIEPLDLNPHGELYFPDMVPAIVGRYGFIKAPSKPEDFDEQKGVTFEGGRLQSITIQRFQMFTHLFVVETASSTTDSERVLEDALTWGAETFGLNYQPGMIKRKIHVSQLTFYSPNIVASLNPILVRMAEKVSARVSAGLGRDLRYSPSHFSISHDPLDAKNAVASFSIEPRAESPYSEHKFFSNAPLPTNEHIELLEELESELSKS